MSVKEEEEAFLALRRDGSLLGWRCNIPVWVLQSDTRHVLGKHSSLKARHPFLQGSERSDVLLLYKVTLSLCVCHCSISGCTEVVLAVWMNWWCSAMVARALVLISSLTEWLLFASSAAYITAINPSRLIVMVIVWAVSDGYYPWPGCWCFMALLCSFISLYLFHTLFLFLLPLMVSWSWSVYSNSIQHSLIDMTGVHEIQYFPGTVGKKNMAIAII